MTGYVYVVESEAGLYKIGYTNDPRRRLTMLRTSSPVKLTLLGVVPATLDDEREIHRLLAPWRVAREWFSPCAAMGPLLRAVRPLAPLPRGDWTRNGNVIRDYRVGHGLQVQQLAALLGVPAPTLSRWEKGRRSVSIKFLTRIEMVTGISRQALRPDVFGGAPEASAA